MAPRPYSEKSSLPNDSSTDAISGIPTQILPETPSPPSLSASSTPSPTPQEEVPVEPFVETVVMQERREIPDFSGVTPCYPTPGDIMPYDHSLPDFIRQITNQPNLANLHALSLRVISTLISLHRMSSYLPNLRELDLEGSVLNSLRDIGCNFKNLQILKVGRCQLESLDGTFGLSSLRELYAQKNFITDVSPCSNLPHIRHIDVSGNRIRNISYAGFLSVCTKLKSIVFTGNPATEVSGYRKHVRRILPQIETLDGISFLNEDESKEPGSMENSCEGSDSSSTGIPDFSSVSPSESLNNFFESEEDLLLDKKNKHAKNLANQDQFVAANYETPEHLPETTADFEVDHDFQKLSLHKNKVKNELLEQAKIIENRNINIKQKCTKYAQKLDKDIENRSKKSNLLLNANFSQDFILSSEFPESPVLKDESVPSTSSAVASNDGSKKNHSKENESTRDQFFNPTDDSVPTQSGAVKKKNTFAIPKFTISDNDEFIEHNLGESKLSTGLPICGNLTAALRSRKKIHTGWDDKKKSLAEASKLEIRLNGSGDSCDIDCGVKNEEEFFGEDLLATSEKWRETFRRFRSNNRVEWEEKSESTDLLRESFESGAAEKEAKKSLQQG